MGDNSNTWDLFDQKKAGSLPKETVRIVIRACGRKYLDKEIDAAIEGLPDPVPKDAFMDFMQQPYTAPTETELRNALAAFDGEDTGELKVSEMISLLTTLGEKMPHEAATAITSDFQPNANGAVSMDNIVKTLTEPVPVPSMNIEDMLKSLPGV